MDTAVPTKVIVYSKPDCVQCNATYKQLDKHGIDYEVVNLLEDTGALERLKSQGYIGAPVVQAGADIWTGFRPDRIKALA